MIEPVLTIKDANCLLAVLDNDIPYFEKNRVSLLLLILAANPSLAENYDVISNKQRQHYYEEYC